MLRTFSSVSLSHSLRSHAKAKISEIDTYKVPLLTDTFNRNHDYLRISLTEKCNLRCFYCMPSEGIPLSPSSHILTDDEIIRLAALFVNAGVTKIRLTGGEPTIRKGIVELTSRFNQLRPLGLQTLAMTSNGLVLHRYLPSLVRNGLTHLNLSLDTLDPFKFEIITRRRGHSAVLRTLKAALSLPGLSRVKLNVVVVRGLNDGEIFDFIQMTKDSPLTVRMIEYMPFQDNKWNKSKIVPSDEILDTLRTQYPTIHRYPDELNDTARNYIIPGYKGSFGFISSMSDHFCASCNRLRLTSDGQIKVCLFDPKEISLRDQLRNGATDGDLLAIIQNAIHGKKWSHGGKDDINDIDTMQNRPMVSIGGNPYARHSNPILHRSFLFPPHIATRTQPPGKMFYSSNARKLTHIDENGRAQMVDVSDKSSTSRTATAQGRIFLPLEAYELVLPSPHTASDPSKTPSELTPFQRKAIKKGDVISTAQIATIMAAKQTSNLIPLCHPIPISKIDVSFTPENIQDEYSVLCSVTVKCEGKTGVEMEVLTAVSIGLLTIWDMLKAVAGSEMRIGDIWVSHKHGGKTSDFARGS